MGAQISDLTMHNQGQPSENETTHGQPQSETPPQSPEKVVPSWLTELGNEAREKVRRHTVTDLDKAIRKFGEESYVNNVENVKRRLTHLGIDISEADEKRLKEIGILLYHGGAVKAGGVLEGLVEVTESTTVQHIRGEGPPPVNVEHVLKEYLACRVEILVVSYKHVEWDHKKFGMSRENFDEIMGVVRRMKKRTFLWVDKVRSSPESRDIRWSPDCSLMYIAFPSYQMANVRTCDRLWITTERDSMTAREQARSDEIPALRAYAVLCRNAIRGDYDNCPVCDWTNRAPFIDWAKRLMSKLFTGKLQWEGLDGTECFQHAAVAVLYNFTTLNVFLRSNELRRNELGMFGPLTSLDFEHKFWPEPWGQEWEDVDVGVENAMDWYIREDDSSYHFLAMLRQGPGCTCYRGTLSKFDGNRDFVSGWLRTGEVFNSDFSHPGLLPIAVKAVWEGEDESTFVKVLGINDLIKMCLFETILTGEVNLKVTVRRVCWNLKKFPLVVKGRHMYLY